MQILSHRGYWKTPVEQNTREAFERSFSLNFGTETDIRDRDSQIVISHDIPKINSMRLSEFFEIYNFYDTTLPLALNIKSDGLHHDLAKFIKEYNISNYFVFDMSAPQTFHYLRSNIRYFTRQSDCEPTPVFYDDAVGVWMDSFERDWIEAKDIHHHLNAGKHVCIVSPELHGRSKALFWDKLRQFDLVERPETALCTDLPEVAEEFFNVNN